MKVALKAQLKNGVLWEAVEKAGSQTALAQILGIDKGRLGNWLNFQSIPRDLDTPRLKEVERRLVEFAGILLEDVFPVELRQAHKSKRTFKTRAVLIREVAISQLIGSEQRALLVESLEEETIGKLDHLALESAASKAVASLKNKRYRDVLALRFGLDGSDGLSQTETAKAMGISRTRVDQIESQALSLLRRPSRSASLRPFVS